MISLLVLLFFFLYTCTLFFIDNLYFLISIFLFNLIISLLLDIPPSKHLAALAKNTLFVIFIVICNLLFNSLGSSIIIGLRLFLVIDFTYIMSFYFNPTNIKTAFFFLLCPLKLFHINVDNLALIIAISLAFIPILVDEASMIKSSLRSKGFDFNLANLFTRPHVYLITYLNGIFNRVEELEKSLIAKAC